MDIKTLVAELKKINYNDTEVKDSTYIVVRTKKNRIEVQAEIAKKLNGTINRAVKKSGSIGHIDIGKFRVLVKPATGMGRISGTDNEKMLVKLIEDAVTLYGPGININFISNNNNFLAEDVKSAKEVGADTKNRKKADVLIIGKKNYPISMKKNNAEYWESADSLWREEARKYISKALLANKVKILPRQGKEVMIVPNLAIEATPEEESNVVFGSDILPYGCVITHTFNNTKINYDDVTNTVIVKVDNIITDARNIPQDKKVWFVIRNQTGRVSLPEMPGLRILAAYKSRAFTGSTTRFTLAQR